MKADELLDKVNNSPALTYGIDLLAVLLSICLGAMGMFLLMRASQ